MTAHESILTLKAKMSEAIIGQENLIERLILVLLATGNMLLEGGLVTTFGRPPLELSCGSNAEVIDAV